MLQQSPSNQSLFEGSAQNIDNYYQTISRTRDFQSGQRLLPYLNQCDIKTVKNQYKKYNGLHDSIEGFRLGIKKRNFSKKSKITATEKVTYLSQQMTTATGRLPKNLTVLNSPLMTGHKVEMIKSAMAQGKTLEELMRPSDSPLREERI